jgi:hypothetical protein
LISKGWSVGVAVGAGVNVRVGAGISVGSAVSVETGTTTGVDKEAGFCPQAETININNMIQEQ